MDQNKTTINIRDIAREAGVSVASVSRALQVPPSKKVSEKRRKQILDICAKYSYQPNEHFRRICNRRADTIAFVFPEEDTDIRISGGFESYMDFNLGACLRGAQAFFAENNMDLLLLEATDNFIASQRYLKMIRGQLLDGVMLWGVTNSSSYIESIINENIPVVMVQNEDDRFNCSKVISDDYSGMRHLVKQVIDAGHRHLAVLRPSMSVSCGIQRMNGINDELSAHGIMPDYISSDEDFSYQLGYESIPAILGRAPNITCIVCSCNATAFGCINALKERNVNVPQDISIAAGGGLNLPGMTYELDSFCCPAREIGRLGGEILLEQINGRKDCQRIVLPTIPVKGRTINVIT